jgi:hypothetical protein
MVVHDENGGAHPQIVAEVETARIVGGRNTGAAGLSGEHGANTVACPVSRPSTGF